MRRICFNCKAGIGKGDKYRHDLHGRTVHRHCDNPTDYYDRATRARIDQGRSALPSRRPRR